MRHRTFRFKPSSAKQETDRKNTHTIDEIFVKNTALLRVDIRQTLKIEYEREYVY